MTKDEIATAENAAIRFVSAVKAVRDRRLKDEYFDKYMGVVGFRETAALRRASMDLTRALADLRRPRK